MAILDNLFGSIGGGKSGPFVGISIGASAIKIVEIQNTSGSWELKHFGTVQLPEDAIVNREIINQLAVVESLKTLINQIELKQKNVCSSVIGTSVIVKKLQVEVQKKKELEEQIFWEAEQYLPFDVSEVFMDFDVVSENQVGLVDVILVAVKKTILESYMAVISDAGLKPSVMDTDFFALQHVFEVNYPGQFNESTCLVDIGAASTKMVVTHSGVPLYTKESATGGNNLTSEIQKHMNLSFLDAEALKVGGDGSGTPQEVKELSGIMVENIALEIKRGIDFYNASSSGPPVTQIFLTGGSSKLGGCIEMVQQNTGIQTQMLNPFVGISYDPADFTQEEILSIGPIASIPVGLALRAKAK